MWWESALGELALGEVTVAASGTAVQPGAASLLATGRAPTVTATGGVTVEPGAASLTVTGRAPVVVSITLNDVIDNWVFQRNGANASIALSGTYTGTPTAIEARIVQDGTSTEVVTWTTLDAAPSGGTFSGSITVPTGGQYNAQVRFSNATGIADNGANAWSVGMTVLMPGDSIARNMFTLVPNNSLTASAGTYVHDLTDNLWYPLTGYSDGAITMANNLVAHFGVPIGLYFEGIGAKKLDEWANNVGGGIYDTMLTDVGSSEVEAVVMIVGINDAATPETAASHAANWASFITNVRADFTNRSGETNLPVFMSLPGGSGAHADADVEAVRQGTMDALAAGTDLYLGVHMPDIQTNDGTHPNAANMQLVGERIALSLIDVLGSGTYHRGPPFSHAVEVDATHTDVFFAHVGGSDFTPTSAITGLDISDDSFSTALTVSAAARQTASSIRLTHTSTASPREVRGLYGAAPALTNWPHDNTTEQLPFEWFAATAVQADTSAAPGAGSLTVTGQAPTVTATANVSAAVPAATLTITGLQPAANVSGSVSVTVPVVSLALAGQQPAANATGNISVDVPAANFSVTGLQPTVTASDHQSVAVPAGALTITGFAPVVTTSANISVEPGTGALVLTGQQPAVSAAQAFSVTVPVGALTLVGLAPTASTGSLALTPGGKVLVIDAAGRVMQIGTVGRRMTIQ